MTSGKLKHIYRQLAFIVFNTIFLFLLINVACGVAIRLREGPARTHNPIATYGMAPILRGYVGRPEGEVVALLHETWDEMDLKSEYEELTGFREAPYRGRFVNVDPSGFRVSQPAGPWPPDPGNFNIFLFGGSTTFGYGVSDGETLASIIQDLVSKKSAMPVFAYNFGRGSHFSTQEFLLYYSLLTSGHVPKVAIFLDGVNDFAHLSGDLDNTSYLKFLVREDNWGAGNGPTLLSVVSRTPMGRAAKWLRRELGFRVGEAATPPYRYDDPAALFTRARPMVDQQELNRETFRPVWSIAFVCLATGADIPLRL